jgi:hypothetical protein
MLYRLPSLLVIGCVAMLALLTSPAAAQIPNLDTVEGPSAGEETTLTVSPHSLTEDVSARALGIESPNSNRFALTLIGVTPADSLGLTLGDKALPIKEISRPAEDEVGPTRIYVTQKTFLTVAEQTAVRLHIGDKTVQLPDQMRKEMRMIFETVV